jgi:hypothetical protein
MNIYLMLITLIRFRAQSPTLERVLTSLGAAVGACSEAITQAKESRDPEFIETVVEEECDVVENLIGAAFVAGQAEITGVISPVMRLHKRAATDGHILTSTDGTKSGIMRLGTPVRPSLPYSHVEVINAFANYFKHHDEWHVRWAALTGLAKQTADTIMALGATEGSTGNLRKGIEVLGIAKKYADLVNVSGMVSDWANAVFTTYESELRRLGSI